MMCQKIPVEADFLYAYSTAPGEKLAKKILISETVSIYQLVLILSMAIYSFVHSVSDYFICLKTLIRKFKFSSFYLFFSLI